MSIAHRFKDKVRTDDVLISESVDFSGLLLSKHVLQGLTEAGFKRPSPIQLKAIPLGRCGLDLIVQAKSGTGKTCVFTVVALESLELESVCVQVLVLAPTREIAIQIHDVIQTVGKAMSGLKCHTFIGGLPLLVDKSVVKNCHIAVGTPGRVKQLIDIGALKTSSIRLFVLDEADKLLEGEFQEAINWIYSTLPDNKQILALSATYTELMAQHLTAYMRNPTFVRLNVTDPALLGIKQYHVVVPNHPMPNIVFSSKTETVLKILSSVSFQQCLIFSNLQTRAQNLQSELQSRNWPTACIAGYLDQKERNLAMEQLKTYKCRILISTDLTSRGIDADKVNLVINLDVPPDHETYLHRIGRAGRFGSFGAAVTIVTQGGQDAELWAVERKCGTYIHKLPDPIPNDLVTRALPVRINDIVSVQQIKNQPVSDMDMLQGVVQSDNACSQNQETQPSSANLVSKQQYSSPQGEDSLVVNEFRNVNRIESAEDEKVNVLCSASISILDSEAPVAGVITNRLRDLSLVEAGVVLEDLYGVVDDHKPELSTENTDSSRTENSTENHNSGTLKDVTLNGCDSQANTRREHLDTSVVEITNTAVNLCNGLVVSKFDEQTSESNRNSEPRLPEEEYLNTLCYVCADTGKAENLMENLDKCPEVKLFKDGKENTGTPDDGQNNFTDNNSCSESKGYRDNMCQDYVPVLLSHNCGKDTQGFLQTSAPLHCTSDRCSGRSSDVSVHHRLEPVQKVVSYIHSISNEILSDALLESHLLNIQAESVPSSLICDDQVASESAQILFCDGGCTEFSMEAASNSKCNNSAETCLQKVESLLIGTHPEKVETLLIGTHPEKVETLLIGTHPEKVCTGNGYLQTVNPSTFIGVDTDDESKSSGEISHVVNDKLTCKTAGHRSVPSARSGRRHVKSFALTDFLHRMNEDLSLLSTKKIGCSFEGEDESSGEDSFAVLAGLDLATLNVDQNLSENSIIASPADFVMDRSVSKQLDLKGGGDSVIASCCLSMETMQLRCDNSSAFSGGEDTMHFQLKSLGGGDCLSHDVSRESGMFNSNCGLPCHVSETSGTNNTEQALNVEVCCPLVCSGEHHNSDEVRDAAITTVNQSTIDTKSETMNQSTINEAPGTVNQSTVNEAHDPIVDLPSYMCKDLNKPIKTLAAYFSLLPLQHQNPDQHFKCVDLEKDCANFCKDFDEKTQLTSCTLELMDNFTAHDSVDSKDLQELCAFETTKLVALKSQFQSKLSEVERKKHEAEERHKSKAGGVRKPQVNSHSHDSLQGEKVGEKPLLSDDSLMHKIHGQKGRSRKANESLNWRNDTVKQTHDIRDEYKGYNSSRKETRRPLRHHQDKTNSSEREDQESYSVENAHTKFNSQNTLEARTAPCSQHQTTKQTKNCHVLDGVHGNAENRSNTGKLNRPNNPHVKTNADAAKDADRTDQKHRDTPPRDRKDDECKELDDMHAQMLLRRKERKLRQAAISNDNKLLASDACNMAPVTELKADHEAGPKTIHNNETEIVHKTTGKETHPVLVDNVPVKQVNNTTLETEHSLAEETKSFQSANEENDYFTCQDETPGSTKAPRSEQLKDQVRLSEGDVKSTALIKDQQRKHKAAEKEKPMQSEFVLISPASPKRPTKPSKSEARLAGLEISSGSTSSTSDLSLSSPSDISDVNLSDLDNKDIILASQCYANKYAHEVCGDLKEKNSKLKNHLLTTDSINLESINEHKHDPSLPLSTEADHCVPPEEHSGVSSKRLQTLCPPAYKDDQDYPITSCGASFGAEHANIEQNQQFQLTADSQAQKHVKEKSGKRRTHEGTHCGKHPSITSGIVHKTRKKADCSKISESDRSSESESETSIESGGEYSSESEGESLSNIDDRSYCHHNQHESCMYSPNHIHPPLYPYPSPCLPWFSPYYSVPHSAWQYGYPTPQHFGMSPAPFYMPNVQLQPFYHLSQYHYQPYVSHHQMSIPQIQWEYIRHMTKMMSLLSRKYSRARKSPQE